MSREICGHQYTTGRTCGWNEKVHGSSSSATHDYSPAVLVPLPLDQEAIYETVGIEMYGPEGPLTGPDERTVRYAADAALEAVLGVTE